MAITFRKADKIKGVKSVQQLFTDPNIVTVYPLKAFFSFQEKKNSLPVKIAVSVSKKRFKKSPERNKIKRVLREAYRMNKIKIASNISVDKELSVMIVYIGSELPKSTFIKEKIKELFYKINQQ